MTVAEDQRIIESLRVQLKESYKENDLLKEERDGAYMERARILAWHIASEMGPVAFVPPWNIVLAEAQDLYEPGWKILYMQTHQGQLSWHLSPEQVKLFPFIERVESDDPRAQWDGHTTKEKYDRIEDRIARMGLKHAD